MQSQKKLMNLIRATPHAIVNSIKKINLIFSLIRKYLNNRF